MIRFTVILLFFMAGSVLLGDSPRIVSLAPALTEIVCYLDGEKYLVGRTSACDYPKSVRFLPAVGRFGTPDVERIVALRPTLVIGNDLMNQNVAHKLRDLGIEVELRQINSMEDYRYWVDFIGRKLGREEAAAQELVRTEKQLKELLSMPAAGHRLLWVVNAKPMMVAGPGSLPDMVIKLMQMQNAADNAPTEYFKCSQEWLLRNDPDMVIWAVPGSPDSKRGVLRNVPAIRKGRVIKNIDRSPVMRPGPRFLEEVKKLRQKIAG